MCQTSQSEKKNIVHIVHISSFCSLRTFQHFDEQ